MAGRRSKKESALKSWWKSKRDRHLQILSMVFLSCIAIMMSCIIQLMVLRESATWEEYTTLAWTLLVLCSLIAIWIGPEFVHYVGQYNLLNEVLDSTARSEVSRRRAEAQEAANLLGSRYIDRLDKHLTELGIKRAKRK